MKREKNEEDETRKSAGQKTTGMDEEDENGTTRTECPDSPNDGIPDMKKASAPTESSCSSSTVATVPMTPMYGSGSVASPERPKNSNALVNTAQHVSSSGSSSGSSLLQRRRRALTREALVLLLLSMISFTVFLFIYLPFMALVALAVFAGTTCLGFYTLYRRFLLEYENLLRGRGIGDYLPESIYVQLAELSLHEWMMDSTFFEEYRHLLLYYVPGITNEQLESMVNRLSPHHQEALTRRGLGQFFGDGFMRLLMGDSRWQPAQHHQLLLESSPHTSDSSALVPQPVVAERIELPAESPPVRSITAEPMHRRLYEASENEESSNDSGLDVTESDLTTGVEERQLSTQVEQEPTSREQEVAAEGQIMVDAFYAMVQSYSQSLLSSATQSLNQLAVQAVEYVSPTIIGIGTGLTTVSASVGLLGVWYGAYYPWRSTSMSLRFPSGRLLVSTSILGGVTAGIAIMIRRRVRDALQAPRDTDGTQNTKDEKK